MEEKRVNLVLEGGGVKGIGLVGAIEEFEANGYTWACLGGTSAGAIVATLLAVGYSGKELREIMTGTAVDFMSIMDDEPSRNNFLKSRNAIANRSWLKLVFAAVPLLYRLRKNHGLFNGDYILETLRHLIKEKTGSDYFTFADLVKLKGHNKLNLMVTDISTGSLLVLPGELKKLNLKSSNMEIAYATRMSMGFPLFFKPVIENNHWLVDGGVLSNFPYAYIDGMVLGNEQVPYPTIGLLLDEGKDKPITGVFTMIGALLNTMIAALDRIVYDIYRSRIVRIKTGSAETLAFDIQGDKKTKLLQQGAKGAQEFISKFKYKEEASKRLYDVVYRESEE